ncbi:MAG: helix-turn-helix domain-containing protein [Bacteroidota bacterium]
MTRVFDAPEPRQSERLMLLALADNANDQGVCWPSVTTLSRKCAVATRRGTQKLLRRVLVWSERAANDPDTFAGCVVLHVEERAGRSNRYRLAYLPPPLAPLLSSTPPRPSRRPGPQDTREPQDAPTPGPQDAPPASSGTPEPSENPQVNPQQHAREATSPTLEAAAAAFLDAKEGKEEDGRRAAVSMLAKRDVEVPVARSLVASCGAARVRRNVAWYDERKRAGKAKGPGLLVKAVRDDLAAEADQRGLLTYAQMLDAFDKLGGRVLDHFEMVPQPNTPDGTPSKPLWRPLPEARGAR